MTFIGTKLIQSNIRIWLVKWNTIAKGLNINGVYKGYKKFVAKIQKPTKNIIGGLISNSHVRSD